MKEPHLALQGKVGGVSRTISAKLSGQERTDLYPPVVPLSAEMAPQPLLETLSVHMGIDSGG